MFYGLATQFIGSLILFINKILLYFGIPIGWIFGIVGISMLIPFTLHQGLTTSFIYFLFLIVFMAYGYYLTTEKSKTIPAKKSLQVKATIIGLALASCVFLSWRTLNDSNFTLLQLGQSITGLLGCLLLAFPDPRSKFAGWSSNIVSHCFAAYIMMHLQTPATWIALFQLLSILFAILGMVDQRKAFTSADVPT